jgi:hypothetical protein
VAGSFSSSLHSWNQAALISKSTFPRQSLSVSAKIARGSDTLLGYGNSNFQAPTSQAYIVDVMNGSLVFVGWHNGANHYFQNCGTSISGATYTLKVTETGVDVLMNNNVVCSVATPLMTSMTDKPVFVQALWEMSYLDDLVVKSDTPINPETLVPGAPSNVTATNEEGQINLSWTQPTANGGPAVTDYRIEYKLSSASSYTIFADAENTTTTASIPNLTGGMSYDFRVSAINTNGAGAPSQVASATPSNDVILFSDSFDSSTLNTDTAWDIVKYAAGNVIMTGSQLGVGNSFSQSLWQWNRSAVSTQRTFPRDGLSISAKITPGSDTLLAYGDSNFQSPGTQAYMINVSGGSVLLGGWHLGNLPYYQNCGGAVSGATYTLRPTETGADVLMNTGTGDVLKCSVATPLMTSMTNKSVFFQASANGSYLDDLTIKGAAATVSPGQVTNLTARGVNKQVVLSWAPVDPASSNKATDYIIEYTPTAEGSWSVFNDGVSPSTKAFVTGLQNGTEYSFRVSAKNARGTGPVSGEKTATPAPLGTLSFVFTGESNSGGIANNYQASAAEQAPRASVQIMNLASGTFQFENLDVGTNNLLDHHGLEAYFGATHGFELSLANEVEAGTFPGINQVYLVKTGQGGSKLSGWNVGEYYWNKFLQRINAAKTQLPASRQWVVWYGLGLNDFIQNTPVETFRTQTIAHLAKIKAELPGTIIVVTEYQASGAFSYNQVIREIAASDPDVFLVNTNSTGAPLVTDFYHYDYQAFKTVGNRMAKKTRDILGIGQ